MSRKKLLKMAIFILVLVVIILVLFAYSKQKDNEQLNDKANENVLEEIEDDENLTENVEDNENIVEQDDIDVEQDNIETEDGNSDETQTAFEEFKGEWTDNQYNNEDLSIKFNLPEDWERYTDEELDELMEIYNENLTDEQKELLNSNIRYELMASNSSGTSNIIITLEETTSNITPEDYLESIETSLEAITILEYDVKEQYTMDVAGVEYCALEAEITGYDMKQYYYVRIQENYLVGIIITVETGDALNEILACFE